jgi:hypothetical protein
MSPKEILTELQKKDPVLFAKLAPQTVGAWIDRTDESPKWNVHTLERVDHGNHPGGLKTRVGVLVS